MPLGSATLDRVLQKIGSWVTINVGSHTFNDYGDGSATFTAYSGEGYVQVLNDLDDPVREGVLNAGDALGYFRMSATLPAGSIIYIIHQGLNYDVVGGPLIPHLSGNQLLQQVNLRRRNS